MCSCVCLSVCVCVCMYSRRHSRCSHSPSFCVDGPRTPSLLPFDPPAQGEQPPADAVAIAAALDGVTRVAPGCVPAYVLLARARLAAGNADAAETALNAAMTLCADQPRSDVLLQLAAVQHAQERPKVRCVVGAVLAADFTYASSRCITCCARGVPLRRARSTGRAYGGRGTEPAPTKRYQKKVGPIII